MIVRDESANLPGCLESVKGLFDDIVVVDTGSKDNTVKIARKYGARTFFFPWIDDFSAARNFGLDRLTTDYAFRMDADDRLFPGHKKRLAQLLSRLGERPPFAYFFAVESSEQGGLRAVSAEHRLWPHRPGLRFRGKVHERIHFDAVDATNADVKILTHGYATRELWRAKLGRNLRILERQTHGSDPLADFDLGRTLAGLGRYPEAVAALGRFLASRQPHPLANRQAYRRLVDCHCEMDDLNAAMAAARRGLGRYPDDARLASQVAGLLLGAGEFGLALEGFREAIRLYDPARPDFGIPSDFPAMLRMGVRMAAEGLEERRRQERADACASARTLGDLLGAMGLPQPGPA